MLFRKEVYYTESDVTVYKSEIDSYKNQVSQ